MAEKTRCEECDRNFPSMDALSMHNAAKHISQVNEKKGISKKSIITIVVIVLLLVGIFFFFNSYEKNTNANVVNQKSQTNNINNQNTAPSSDQEVQKITLSMKSNYYPNTITVKSGIPVEIILDSSVKGCYRSFNIPGLGVSKYSSAPADIIKFTPSKKGSFKFQCSMAMGTGTIIVE